MFAKSLSARAIAGFSMMEVLVSLVIIMLGLMGLAGMLVRMQQSEFESYQRAQALVLLHDMVDRVHVHRVTATCFAQTDASTGTPYFGVGSTIVPACSAGTSNDNTRTNEAMLEWSTLLTGATETKGGTAAGAMVGARGCVSYDATSLLNDPTGTPIAGTGIYTVAVTWQGTGETFTPTVNCANGLYGPEGRRRLVFTTFRLAALK